MKQKYIFVLAREDGTILEDASKVQKKVVTKSKPMKVSPPISTSPLLGSPRS